MPPFRIFGGLRNPGVGHVHSPRATNITVNGVANFFIGARDSFIGAFRNPFQQGAGPLAFMRPLFNPFMSMMPPFMQNWFGGMPMNPNCGMPTMPMGGMPMMPMGAMPMGPMGAMDPMAPPAAAPRILIDQMTHDGLAARARAGTLLAGGVVNRGLLPVINAGNWANADANITANFNLADGDALPAWVTALTAPQQRQVCQFISAYIQEVANQTPAGPERGATVLRLGAIANRWNALTPA